MVALVSVDGNANLNFIGCIFVSLYSIKTRVESLDTLLYSTRSREFSEKNQIGGKMGSLSGTTNTYSTTVEHSNMARGSA